MILCLTEAVFLDSWDARFMYMSAKSEQKRLELYQMDLLWLIAKRWYPNLAQPSDVADDRKMKDTRTAKQIQDDILRQLGGEE